MVDSQSIVNPDPRRALPSVGRLSGKVSAARRDLPEWAVTEAARQLVAEAREQLEETESPKTAWIKIFKLTRLAFMSLSSPRHQGNTGDVR